LNQFLDRSKTLKIQKTPKQQTPGMAPGMAQAWHRHFGMAPGAQRAPIDQVLVVFPRPEGADRSGAGGFSVPRGQRSVGR